MFSKEMNEEKTKNETKLFSFINKLAKIRSIFTYLNVIWHIVKSDEYEVSQK